MQEPEFTPQEVDPQSFDAVAVEYDFMATLHRDPSFFLDNLPAARGRALDVGCGSGLLVAALAPHFDKVLGMDISEPMLTIARHRRDGPNIEYAYGDANDLAVDGRFDLITSHTTFHHLRDVPATLRRLKTLLAPGGRLLIVDNCSRRAAVPRYVYQVGAFVDLPRDLLRFGGQTALRLFRFRRSRAWLDHLTSDRYLSEQGFRDVYGSELPGAEYTRPFFMRIAWTAPAPEPPSALDE